MRRAEVGLGVEDRPGAAAVLVLGPVVEALDQVLLGGEVVVGVAHRHPGLGGDGPHGGGVVAGSRNSLRAASMIADRVRADLVSQSPRGTPCTARRGGGGSRRPSGRRGRPGGAAPGRSASVTGCHAGRTHPHTSHARSPSYTAPSEATTVSTRVVRAWSSAGKRAGPRASRRRRPHRCSVGCPPSHALSRRHRGQRSSYSTVSESCSRCRRPRWRRPSPG